MHWNNLTTTELGEFNNIPNEILLYKGIAFNSYNLIVSTRFLRLLLSTFEHNGFMVHFITLKPQLTGWNSDAFSYIISINFREIGSQPPSLIKKYSCKSYKKVELRLTFAFDEPVLFDKKKLCIKFLRI